MSLSEATYRQLEASLSKTLNAMREANPPGAAYRDFSPKRPATRRASIGTLRRWQDRSGMSMEQFADFLGVSRVAVWKWFRTVNPVYPNARSRAIILEKCKIDLSPRPTRRRR